MTLTDEPPSIVAATGSPTTDHVRAAVERAGARVAPLWPLSRFVAVNPYVGMADHPFEHSAERLASLAGIRAALPIASYLALVDEGRITRQDLADALAGHPDLPGDVDAFLADARSDTDDEAAWAATTPTVASVAADVTGTEWGLLLVDRVSAWAAAYFDEGQALWRSAATDLGVYAAWREEAEIDRTPEVAGLRGFRKAVAALPSDATAATHHALAELGVPADRYETYLHALLLQVGGWAGHVRRLVFESDLHGRSDERLAEFTAILVSWELALLQSLPDQRGADAWKDALGRLPDPAVAPLRVAVRRRMALQDAFDRSAQRALVDRLSAGASPAPAAERPDAQAVFCIDVRSEVMRRHLEAVAPGVDTIGFAGFFGMPVDVTPLAHDHGEAQCPVLLTPACAVPETAGDAQRSAEAADARRAAHQVRRAWKSFKMGAISCFSFVGPVGLVYLPKLFTDGWGRTRPVPRPEDEGLPAWAQAAKGPDVSAIELDQRVALGAGALTAMSLRQGLAPLVLIVGHGATTVNNPYDTGLDCGACGGHTGEANARVAAAVLNDPEVRHALREQGIEVPDDTWFVAAQHDTTTDRISVFDRDQIPSGHLERLATLEAQLAEAGGHTRRERAVRMPIDLGGDVDAQVLRRSTDWAQVRPEWGLAGCQAFVVAPRARTQGVDLGGRSFLHSYDWTQDDGFGVLELIMTAPMVVASWISLQYYGSSVDNDHLGSGNKVLHNVVGRLGVLEGNAGDLRVGLPLQSVHDGERLQHEPLRLNVVIAAPIDAMNDVIARHEHVRHLLDHRWLHLLAMDDDGRIAHRYVGNLQWEPLVT